MNASLARGREFPEALFRRAPKAELHVHLEGTVSAQTLLDLAAKHGIEPPASDPAGITAWHAYENFPQFLEHYFFVCDLLREPDDFRRVAREYLTGVRALGAVHVEFHVSASHHVATRGADWPAILAGIDAGCADAERACGISALMIPDLVANLGLAACHEVLDVVLAHPHPRIAAIGILGPSSGWFAEDFASLARLARGAGLHVVAHAGEHGAAQETRHAVEVFGAERIQHGIRAVDDAAIIALLRERGVPCDVCPASNIALGAVANAASHTLPVMVAAGLAVTLSSDDPPFVHSDVLHEFRLAWQMGLDADALAAIARASLLHCFAPEARRRAWLAAWDGWDAERRAGLNTALARGGP